MTEFVTFPPQPTSYSRLHHQDLQPEELEVMQQLYRNDAAEAYSEIVADTHTQNQLHDYFSARADNLPETLADPIQRFWLAKQGTTVVGMAGYNVNRRLIHSVYISRDTRGQQIGSGLMRQVLQETALESQEQPRSVLVASANTRAISFYQRMGFVLSGRTKEWTIGTATIPELELEI